MRFVFGLQLGGNRPAIPQTASFLFSVFRQRRVHGVIREIVRSPILPFFGIPRPRNPASRSTTTGTDTERRAERAKFKIPAKSKSRRLIYRSFAFTLACETRSSSGLVNFRARARLNLRSFSLSLSLSKPAVRFIPRRAREKTNDGGFRARHTSGRRTGARFTRSWRRRGRGMCSWQSGGQAGERKRGREWGGRTDDPRGGNETARIHGRRDVSPRARARPPVL